LSKYEVHGEQKLYFYDILKCWVIRLTMLFLKLKNDLLLLMKNFEIILFFLKQRVSKVFNNKIQIQKKILLKHIVDIHTHIDMHELRILYKCMVIIYISTSYFYFITIVLDWFLGITKLLIWTSTIYNNNMCEMSQVNFIFKTLTEENVTFNLFL